MLRLLSRVMLLAVTGLSLCSVAAAQVPFSPGLPADFKEKSRQVQATYPKPFKVGAVDRAELRSKSVYLWDAVLLVQSPRKAIGQHYTCGPQETGDCVSWGLDASIFYTLANAIRAGKAGSIDDPFPAFTYGVTRVTQGGGRPRCGSAGAYPSDAAEAFKRFGWLTYGEAATAYSGALADQLGCRGPSSAWLALAKVRSGGDCYPIRTVDELLEALHNGYAGTAGIDWQPGTTRNSDGRIITEFNGRNRGGHQIAWVGWDAQRQQLIYHNSHGTTAHPRNEGDPPGSFRVSLRTLESQIANGEYWAVSAVPGFPPQQINFDRLRPRPRR